MGNMRYISILPTSTEDYYGFSVVILLSGCSHKCEGCWSKASWKHTSGTEFTEETYLLLKSYLDKPYIDNLVLQGGDPLYSKNYKEVIDLCVRIKKELPSKKIVLFTGYTYKEILQDMNRAKVLSTIDVLIDGKYEQDSTKEKPFRGSDNQELIILKNFLLNN